MFSKLTITESSNRATQYKKIVDALPVYFADKGYQYVNNIICKNTKLLGAGFEELYPDSDLWSTKFHIEIDTVDPHSAVGINGFGTTIKETVEKTCVFNTNFQKQLLLEYKQKSKVKSQ